MVAALADSGNASSSFSSDTAPGNTQHTINRPASAVQGTYLALVLTLSVAGTGVFANVTAPSGWTLLTSGDKSGTPSSQVRVYGKVMTGSEPSSYVFTYDQSANVTSQYFVASGGVTSATASWLVQAAGNTSRITPSVTVAANTLLVYGTHDRNSSGPLTYPGSDGAASISFRPSSAVSLNSTSPGVLAAGTYSYTMTGAFNTSVAGSYIISFAAAVVFATQPLANWLAATPLYVAHRGYELDYPEETLSGYVSAAAWNVNAMLEISVRRTTDGIWVCNHDVDTARVFSQANATINAVAFSAISGYTTIIGAQPLAKMVDVMAAHQDRLLMVDCKPLTNQSEFLDLMDANGGPGRILLKVAGSGVGSTAFADLAAARGYKTWGYFYDADKGTEMDNDQTHYAVIGMDYTATQAAWTQALGYGKQVIGHIVPNVAARNTAIAFGAVGVMASKAIDGTVPQGVGGSGSAAYYQALSGLPAGLSLADYEYAYFKSVSGIAASNSLADHRYAFWSAQTGIKDRKGAEMAYYAAQIGTTIGSKSIGELRRTFYASKGY